MQSIMDVFSIYLALKYVMNEKKYNRENGCILFYYPKKEPSMSRKKEPRMSRKKEPRKEPRMSRKKEQNQLRNMDWIS